MSTLSLSRGVLILRKWKKSDYGYRRCWKVDSERARTGIGFNPSVDLRTGQEESVNDGKAGEIEHPSSTEQLPSVLYPEFLLHDAETTIDRE